METTKEYLIKIPSEDQLIQLATDAWTSVNRSTHPRMATWCSGWVEGYLKGFEAARVTIEIENPKAERWQELVIARNRIMDSLFLRHLPAYKKKLAEIDAKLNEIEREPDGF